MRVMMPAACRSCKFASAACATCLTCINEAFGCTKAHLQKEEGILPPLPADQRSHGPCSPPSSTAPRCGEETEQLDAAAPAGRSAATSAMMATGVHLQAAHVLRVRGKLQLLSQQPPHVQYYSPHNMYVTTVVTAVPTGVVTI